MDRKVKEKAWTRNIHQKFDVVRQEVDEFVSMGTIKYVENQVQTLGETVKGFCSNVFQDFLPPTLSNPVNHDAGTVPQKGNVMTDTYKKSVTNLREKYVDTDAKLLPSALSDPVNHDAGTVLQKGNLVTEAYKKSVANLREKYVDTDTKFPSAFSNPVNYDAGTVPQKRNFVTETYKKNLREKYVDTDTKLLPSDLSNPVNHDGGTVPKKGKFVTETYKKSVTNLREKYVDTDTKLLSSALSNPVNYDADSVPQNEIHATQNSNKPLNIIKENYADVASKRMSTKQDSVHHVPPYYRCNNVKQTNPMPTEGDKKITKALFPLAREGYIGSDFGGLVAKEISSSKDSNSIRINDEKSLVVVTEDYYHNHEITDKAFPEFEGLVAKEKYLYEDFNSIGINDEKSLVVTEDYYHNHEITDKAFLEFEGLVAKEKSLYEDLNSIGINDETSLVFVTKDDYRNHEITDEAVSAAEDDSLRVCSSVEERTCDNFFDDCHCNILGIPRSSDMESSLSCGCQVVEPTLFSSTSSLSNNSYYQSFYNIPHEPDNFAYDHTDSVSVFETPGHADELKNDTSDPKLKSIDLFEKTKLNESVVIVDTKLLDATSCRPRRHRSYKQMIKDAYTKSKRITKEYELLGILYGDIDKEPLQHEKHSRLPSISERTPGNEHSQTEDLGDSDWELL
ncbi:hypothetical protein POM88_004695 [Heracleum sosnowskyi]|uniref:Uncharacterized protein n=1 Tax=Heracleum sosnowskyi TaxID=360622 RepID=A0AAD8N7Y6_9APIA|nr:hypothetical protein POM88_004695 [Heracleum sosnowskyi]